MIEVLKMRRKLVLGNWKMHGAIGTNAQLLQAIRQHLTTSSLPVDVGVCVPAPYLSQTRDLLTGSDMKWGAQDVSAHAKGAFTGEISAAMLAEFGSQYVIVGHSERRAYHGETADAVGAKARQAIVAGLVPVVCVGETLHERDAGMAEQVVRNQLSDVLAFVGSENPAQIVIAYEPVWAIGTGRSASAADAQAIHAALRACLSEHGEAMNQTRILYGGSIKPNNAHELLTCADIDGALIGGASLVASDFISIIDSASRAASASTVSDEVFDAGVKP
ncbi:triose-phosphate isomerase [Paraburkholderia phenoliruptrix]|uniref:triose-phosphate isomerase n=1 Tax=Paraburkholderia phenoliruptrix TaxID=252970 RepID=UPI0028698841|nr:triose-phosphate isomerase [Paraburkholderia phenoliruptrix]WMY11811.1 triose-phosphate isomerase [Paraburkholderia phenoliruptrix]